MARRGIHLLIMAGLTTACGVEFPRDLYIDDRFTEVEEGHVLWAIDSVNGLGQELLEKDLIIYRGRFGDMDSFSVDDLDDGRNELFRISDPDDENYRFLQETNEPYLQEGGTIAGYAPRNVVLVFMFNLRWYVPPDGCAIDAIISDPDDPSTFTPPESPEYSVAEGDECGIDPHSFRATVLHELGHFIGLGHIMEPDAVMTPIGASYLHFTDKDKEAFCLIYDCVNEP